MAAFTRETQVGTSAEIVDAYFAWIQSPASSISIRGAILGSRGYDFIVTYLVSVR
jgi:hypothetical protein